MEHLTRFLSWSFVFGALATLLYTNFKPAWKALLDEDVPVESVQGTAADPEGETIPAVLDAPATAQKECNDSDPTDPSGNCANPSS